MKGLPPLVRWTLLMHKICHPQHQRKCMEFEMNVTETMKTHALQYICYIDRNCNTLSQKWLVQLALEMYFYKNPANHWFFGRTTFVQTTKSFVTRFNVSKIIEIIWRGVEVRSQVKLAIWCISTISVILSIVTLIKKISPSYDEWLLFAWNLIKPYKLPISLKMRSGCHVVIVTGINCRPASS